MSLPTMSVRTTVPVRTKVPVNTKVSVSTKMLSMLAVLLVLLSGCQNPTEQTTIEQRATLADLAKAQVANELQHQSAVSEDTRLMSKAERSAILASLYKNILTLEPDVEVRTKIEYRLVQIKTQA